MTSASDQASGLLLKGNFGSNPRANRKRKGKSVAQETGSRSGEQKKRGTSSDSQDDKLDVDPQSWLKEHGNYLFRFALSRVRDEEVAQDLVQETLVAALRNVDRFEGKCSVRVWLISIIKNKVIDYFRKSNRQLDTEEYSEDPEHTHRYFTSFGIWNTVLSNWAGDGEKLLEQRQFLEIMREGLDNLPENQRRAFVMKVIDGMESEAICKVLDISPSNLWTMLHRARNSLRAFIESKWLEK